MHFTTIAKTIMVLALGSFASAAVTFGGCVGVHGLNGYQGNTFQVSVGGIAPNQINSICGAVNANILETAAFSGVSVGSNNCGTSNSAMAFTIQMDKQAWTRQAALIIVALQDQISGFPASGTTCSCIDGC